MITPPLLWTRPFHYLLVLDKSPFLIISLIPFDWFVFKIRFAMNSSPSSSPSCVLIAPVPLTLSNQSSQEAIDLDKSSRSYLLSVPKWWVQVFAGRLTLVLIYVGAHWRTAFMRSSFSSLQFRGCLGRSYRLFEMRSKWPYSCCFVGCCFQDLFKTARNVLVYYP